MVNDVKVLKLITGEEIITKVIDRIPTKSPDGNNLIIIEKPLVLQAIHAHQGNQSIQLIPWIGLCKDEKLTISTECILCEGDPTKEAENIYLSRTTGLTL